MRRSCRSVRLVAQPTVLVAALLACTLARPPAAAAGTTANAAGRYDSLVLRDLGGTTAALVQMVVAGGAFTGDAGLGHADEKKPGRDPEVPPRLSGPESVSGAGSYPEGSAGSVVASEKLVIGGRAVDSGDSTCFVYRSNPFYPL